MVFAEKKLRSILYDIRIHVETEVQVLQKDDEHLEGEEIHEEESVEDGHVVMQQIRTRRVLVHQPQLPMEHFMLAANTTT